MWTEKLSNGVVCGNTIYVNRTDIRTHAQTKFSIEHTSVGLTHARPTTTKNKQILLKKWLH